MDQTDKLDLGKLQNFQEAPNLIVNTGPTVHPEDPKKLFKKNTTGQTSRSGKFQRDPALDYAQNPVPTRVYKRHRPRNRGPTVGVAVKTYPVGDRVTTG